MDSVAYADCEQVHLVRDRAAGATALVVVHDTRLGPAHGGIRRWPYEDLGEALRDVVALARAMTWKCALAGVPAGGGKAVIVDHPGLDRAAAYRLVGRLVEQLGGAFFTGPDVNTTAADLEQVAAETRFVATESGDGPGDLAAATATGVAAAMAALAERLGLGMHGLHVAVQGLGAVGMALCALLVRRGARLTVADTMPQRAAEAAQRFGAVVVPVAAIRQTPCEVFAPCALGGVIDAAVAAELPARGVCGAANNVFADERAAAVLHQRGVLAVPDFIANAGALIQGACWNFARTAPPPGRIERIADTVHEVFVRAARAGVPPLEEALRMARERVERGVQGT